MAKDQHLIARINCSLCGGNSDTEKTINQQQRLTSRKMSRVELRAMKIANFKGIKSIEGTFGDYTQITGDNGTGKSSVYDAYLWCLFGKNYEGKELPVQPLTKDNEVVHKVDTVVELELDVDGVKMTVKRVQKEKWSVPRGQLEPILQGNTQERFINDVPYSVRDFDEKLGKICPVQEWFMLSSISAFMGLKMEDRRKKLQLLTGEISEYEIAKDFPSIIKAFYDGKSVDELIRQNRLTRKTAQTDLDQIPARIDQQERLRIVDVDFAALESDKVRLETERANVEALLNEHLGNRPETASNEYPHLLAECNQKIAKIEHAARVEIESKRGEINNRLYAAKSDLNRVQYEKSSEMSKISRLSTEKEREVELLTQAGKTWQNQNMEAYEDKIDTVCPVCGQDLPVFKVQEAQENAIQAFNERKLKRLAEIEEEGKRHKARIESIKAEIDGANTHIQALEQEERVLVDKVDAITKELHSVPTLESALKDDTIYAEQKAKHAEIMQAMSAAPSQSSVLAEYNAKTQTFQMHIRQIDNKLREINEKLAAEKTNARIDAEKARLEEESKTLAQTVADCDRVDYEVRLFKKKKISIVESRVSSLFEIVRWKMYEPNLTNDGEKEICQAIIDGVPYETQNTATRINAGIDIINGLSKALGCQVPLFVDNTESVTTMRPAATQTITLTVVQGQNLNIK